ncbi:MBL fold metallo-hydrolase [Streptomyces orinoci]|uniref:MBL fold metallo-hydrolase n=1 Tax=Streptomyces orinoci TaxID=67339 RepID=A0ABV3JY28_STRON|nr:MBL fold metallo-hydrolase [Streptomyces orinoci]
MTMPPYTKGLHRVGTHTYAYLQPDGSWGLSNSGLVVDEGEGLLVDTLFTLALTEELRSAIAARLPGVEITTVVNTHDDGDHTFGNQLFADRTIIGSAAMAAHLAASPSADYFRALIERAVGGEAPGALETFVRERMGSFDLSGIEMTPPNSTFAGRREVGVGRQRVHLIQVGPAHTEGDVLVEVPADGVLFTGDILFAGSHPVIHSGPVGRWIEACELIEGMAVETVVPGHGPVTGKPAVRRLRGYLERVAEHAERGLRAGLSVSEAAGRFPLEEYADWTDPERIVLNIGAVYRELGAEDGDFAELFVQTAEFWAGRR